MTRKRYSQKSLPSYIFVPGQNPHPKKEGGHMEGKGEPVAAPLNPNHPEESPEFCFGIDLFNHRYFWESHVYFEALWNAHNRQGEIADFLKALIKLSAAGVKNSLNQPALALDHYQRALELLEDIKFKSGITFLGFDLEELLKSIRAVMDSLSQQIFLHPSWE